MIWLISRVTHCYLVRRAAAYLARARESPPRAGRRIPMQPTSRSLNVSNAVAIVLYGAGELGLVGGR